MIVKITIDLLGGDAGPFNVYSNSTGAFLLVAAAVDKALLVAGYSLTMPNGTTITRVQSIGECTNYIDIPIETSSPTPTPTIFLPEGSLAASCNSTNIDDTTVTKRFLINVTNPPVGYTTGVTTIVSTGGSSFVTIVTVNTLKYVQVTFNTAAGASASVSIRLSLRDQSAQEVAYSEHILYNDHYSNIPDCVF